MTDKPITTVSEFITWTKDLVGSFLLYRGLGDATWKVEESAAHRRVRNSQKDNVSDFAVQEYVEQLLNEASSAGFRDTEGKKLSDLELLAKLQHHGAATCLIDFTANALIALWFACREKPDKPGKVVAMATGNPDLFSIINYQDLLDKRIGEFLKENKLSPLELRSAPLTQIIFFQGSLARRYTGGNALRSEGEPERRRALPRTCDLYCITPKTECTPPGGVKTPSQLPNFRS